MAEIKISPEFESRLKRAKQWRTSAEPLIKDVLSFCAPGRERDFERKASTTVYEGDRYFSAEDMTMDLAGDLVGYYTPPEGQWMEFLVNLPAEFEDAKPEIEARVNQREMDIADALTGSNYYDIAPAWAFEAASHGTPALWVTRAHVQQPLFFEVVLPHQLYITPGHLNILDRFREVSNIQCSTLKALFQGYPVDLSSQSLTQKMANPNATCTVMWGFWVSWEDAGNPVWMCQITVDNKAIMQPITIGPLSGGCPLQVGRFNPTPGMPWGRGPGWKALMDLRMIDKMDELMLSGADQAFLRTLIYADDGYLDLEGGLEAGAAYAAGRNFTRDQIYEAPNNNKFDQGWMVRNDVLDRIRTSFYQDGPRQRGETPPTSTQWMDERRRVQQRLGKPSAPLFSEFLIPMIQRVEFLLAEQGDIEGPISHNGRVINTLPISPLQKSANMDKVMTTRANLEMAMASFGPEAVPQIVDMQATFKGIVKASGDELIQFSKQETNGAPTPPTAPPPQA